jgi:hypothetical protein
MPDGKYGRPTADSYEPHEPRHSREPGPRREPRRVGLPRLRGVALPAVLVGASAVLVLIVVAVSALTGGGPGIIPLAGHASSADQGRVLDKQTQAVRGGQAAPGAGASGAFQVSMEAETATLAGSAAKSDCDGCSGRGDVRFIGNAGDGSVPGTVTFSGLKVPAPGTYHLTVGCVLGDITHGPFVVTVDGAAAGSVTCPVGGWGSVSPTTVAITLAAAASHTIALGNPTMAAPDLDAITLSK